MIKSTKLYAATTLMLFAMLSGQAKAVPVDLELSLLVDVSGSVSTAEFNLQRQGYIDAFNDSEIHTAIQAGALGSIAVNFIYWSSAGSQQEAVGWTQLFNAASSTAFATALGSANRPFGGSTAPGSAIAFADPLFDNNGYEGTREVIDVSGDGAQNSGVNTAMARDIALAGGIDAINGIVIGGSASVLNFYQTQVQGGTDSFTLTAASFQDFGDAVKDKLKREIIPTTPMPEPSVIALFGLGLLGLGFARRKVRS